LIYDSITSFWTFFWASTLCVIIPSPKFWNSNLKTS
jgi:hypothetical protein